MADELLDQPGEIVTRKQAKAAGLRYYFTGKPCHRGHVSKRFTTWGSCYECTLGMSRVWKSANRGRVLAYASAYAKEHKEQINLRERTKYTEWRTANPIVKPPLPSERVCIACGTVKPLSEFHAYRATRLGVSNKCRSCAKALAGAWYRKNPTRAAAMRSNYYFAHKDWFAANNRSWHQSNPGASASYSRRRRALRLGSVGEHTPEDVTRIRRLQRNRCAICSHRLLCAHADHIVPLVLGGSNAASNIQLLCPTCNLRKGRKHPLQYMRQLGRLL